MSAAPLVSEIDPSSIDFEVFALFLEARRIHRRKTVTRVAREAGVEIDAVQRAVRGRNPGADEFLALANWIGEQPEFFTASRRAPAASPPAVPAGRANVPGGRSPARPLAEEGGHG